MPRFSSSFWLRMVCVAAFLLLPGRIQAQTEDNRLSQRLVQYYFDNVAANIFTFLELFPQFQPQILANTDQLAEGLLPAFAMSKAIGTQISSFPLGSSAGGFSWTFDPSLGTFNRVSESFGPVFSERALTVGRRRLNVGINFQRTTYDSIEDRDLSDGGIKTYFGLRGVFPPGTLNQIFIEDSLHLEIATNTVGLFATYGITDRLDVGVAVPVTQVRMRARFDSRLGINNELDPDVFFTSDPLNASATGIGDVVVRGKYILWRTRGGGVAAGLDVRVPSGDELDWLGVAGHQTKLYGASSMAMGRWSPHFNVGFTFSGKSSLAKDDEAPVFPPPNEFSYAAGVDVSMTPTLTVVGDVVGRTLRDFGRIVDTPSPFGANYRPLGFEEDQSNLNLLLGSVGVKYNVFRTSLLAFNVLFPLNDNGLRDKLTWVVGMEHSFGLKR